MLLVVVVVPVAVVALSAGYQLMGCCHGNRLPIPLAAPCRPLPPRPSPAAAAAGVRLESHRITTRFSVHFSIFLDF